MATYTAVSHDSRSLQALVNTYSASSPPNSFFKRPLKGCCDFELLNPCKVSKDQRSLRGFQKILIVWRKIPTRSLNFASSFSPVSFTRWRKWFSNIQEVQDPRGTIINCSSPTFNIITSKYLYSNFFF